MVGTIPVARGDVYLVDLSPTRGGEIRKARPCVVVSPDEPNSHLRSFIVAPLTSGKHAYPFRIACRFRNRSGHMALDQTRTIDRQRLVRSLVRLPDSTVRRVLAVLQEMFAS